MLGHHPSHFAASNSVKISASRYRWTAHRRRRRYQGAVSHLVYDVHVDLLYFLDRRLEFIRYFYGSTTPVFAEIKRKIDAGEEPYQDHRDPEYVDEPAFLKEWEDADIAAHLVGAHCLAILQVTLQAFLTEYVKEIGCKHLLSELPKKGSWFEKYREMFLHKIGIDWRASGADIELLEQVNLTRNDFFHNVDIMTLYTYQDPRHAEKYPDTAFADPRVESVI